jgi:hypothetical protein
MKKHFLWSSMTLLILGLILTACSFPGSATEAAADQTLVALAFTQTAIAEPEVMTAEAETVTEESTEAPVTTEEPTLTPTEINHELTPGEPGYITKWFYDTDSSQSASSGGVTAGDDFVANLFERPFTANEMVYRPDLNITRTEITSDSNFYYTNLILDGEHPDGGLPGTYGIEIDWDRDGRGDLLVLATGPRANDWSINGVKVYKDTNNDVGGSSIMRPDASYNGDAYETALLSAEVLDDPDLAWARYTPGAEPVVTLAFKKSVVENGTFVWGVWAGADLLTPENIDLHDHVPQADAGSPYPSHADYPLADLSLVDNTCRETYGFEALEPIAGLCYIPEPPEPTPTMTPTVAPGSITGIVFYDSNTDGAYNGTDYLFPNDVTVTLHNASCSNAAISSTTNNSFAFNNLAAGSYCVKAVPSGGFLSSTPTEYNLTVSPGGSNYVEFGFFVIN